jgi:hypothetical protein
MISHNSADPYEAQGPKLYPDIGRCRETLSFVSFEPACQMYGHVTKKPYQCVMLGRKWSELVPIVARFRTRCLMLTQEINLPHSPGRILVGYLSDSSNSSYHHDSLR